MASDQCNGNQINADGVNEANQDLVIYVIMKNEPEAGWLAWAVSCNQDEGSFRPNVGIICFNQHFLKTSGTGVAW